MNAPLLRVEQLQLATAQETLLQPLSFDLDKGSCLGLVGESGSGKSLTSLAIMGLLPEAIAPAGKIYFQGEELLTMAPEARRKLRGRAMSMIFQEPMSSLNPSQRCGYQVEEVLRWHSRLTNRKRRKRVLELLEEVELPQVKEMARAYPHQLSGGQKQRIMIAMALACRPALLIADEPTTALDVSVQASILKLMARLGSEYEMGMLFISHDLAVVRSVAHQVLVLQKGETREYGSTEKIFKRPHDVYTQGLLACRPTPETTWRRLPLVRDFLSHQEHQGRQWQPAEKDRKALERTRQEPLFRVEELSKTFKGKPNIWGRRRVVSALDKVSLAVYPGESLGLVGESGSGKTTLGRMLVGLEPLENGQVYFREKPLPSQASALRLLRKQVQIIFQDPYASLNPRLRIGESINEVLRVQQGMSRRQARSTAQELLEKVGLLPEYYQRYPHAFSGGQRQRIGIARALAVEPQFIVCDESVSALDVSVQAQILNLLNDLKEEYGLTYLFISHDLNVVKYFCDRIAVLQEGKLVESGPAEGLYRSPKEAYTRKLIRAVAG
ncbi:MAG: ABC transporter ATP-binding protein [Schleiferiaceae bacterium]|nr:ABC transporter ATP-binding protein [Schleiferiaceae bacterium]